MPDIPNTVPYAITGPWSGTLAQYDVIGIIYPTTATYAAYSFKFVVTPSATEVSGLVGATGAKLNGSYLARADFCTLVEDIGQKPITEIILPELNIEISRSETDYSIDALITALNTYWIDVDGWTLELYARAKGAALVPASHLIYSGTIAADGFGITADTVSLRCMSDLSKYDIDFPVRTFSDEFDPYGYMQMTWGGIMEKGEIMDPDILSKVIPVIFGDWTDPPSWYSIPCFIINRRNKIVQGDNQIKVAVALSNHGTFGEGLDYSGRAWWRDSGGADKVSKRAGKLLVDAFTTADTTGDSEKCTTFELEQSQSRYQGVDWAQGDTVYLRSVIGNMNLSNVIIEEPAAIIYHLLRVYQYGMVPAAHVDDSLNPASGSFVSTGMKLRGYVDEQKKLITKHVAEICQDAGLIFYEKEGKFAVAKRPLFVWEYYPAVAPSVWRINPTVCQQSQKHALRPRDWEVNGIRLRYDYNPAAGEFRKMKQWGRENAFNDPEEPYLEIESRWIWRDEDARTMAGNYYHIINPKARVLEISVPIEGLNLSIGSVYRLEYTGDGLDGSIFYICKIEKDYKTGAATVTAIRMQKRWYGAAWTSDAALSFTDPAITDALKKTGGFWTADDGTINGVVGSSDYSHWREW